jgi:hypothetical protein
MTNMLTEEMTFGDYPPPSSHVKRLPIITYEGILQTNTLRLILYGFCDTGTYNARAISTLAAESFFSDLTAIEFTTTGCPKAVQIPTLLAQVTQMNKHKHDPEKYFFMELSERSVYPTHTLDVPGGSTLSSAEYFKSHSFDRTVTRTERRKVGKNFKLNEPDKTAKGTRGVRQHYKVDQSKIGDLFKIK